MSLRFKEISELHGQIKGAASLAKLESPRLILESHDVSTPEKLKGITSEHALTYQRVLQAIRAEKNNLELPPESELQAVLDHISQYRFGVDAKESPLQLKWHQNECLHNFHKMLEQGLKWGWVQLPTGSGKTPLEIALISSVGKKSIILEPTIDLIDNAVKEINEYAPHLKATKFNGNVKDISGDIVVSTYQSLPCLLRELEQNSIDYGMVVLDEAHEALSPLRRDLIHRLARDKILVALTATPEYDQTKTVSSYYGECLYQMSLAEGIDFGLLAEPRHFIIATNIDLSDLEGSLSGNDWDSLSLCQLNKIFKIESRNRVSINILNLPQFKGVPAVIPCYTVEHAKQWAADANDSGIPAAVVYGEMPIAKRNEIYQQFADGKIHAISFVDVINLGWNQPKATICMNLRDSQSEVLATQRFGRVTRLHPGKECCISFDFFDRNGILQGVTVPELLKDRKRPLIGSTAASDHIVDQEKLEKQNKVYKETVDAIKPALDGEFDVLYDLNEVFVARSKQKSDRNARPASLSADDCYKILTENAFSSSRAHGLVSTSDFYGYQFHHELFTGSGENLLKIYLETQGALPTPNALNLGRFFRDVFNDDYAEKLKQDYLTELKPGVLRLFLSKIASLDPELVYQEKEIEFGIPPKTVVVSAQEVVEKIFKNSTLPRLDDFGITKLIETYHQNAAKRSTRDSEDFYEAWDSVRTLHELSEAGILESKILSEFAKTPTLKEFSSNTIKIAGRDVQGKFILEYYAVSTDEDFERFWGDLCSIYSNQAINIPDDRILAASRISMFDARTVVGQITSKYDQDNSKLLFQVGPLNARVEVNYDELLEALRLRPCFGKEFSLNDEGIRRLAEFGCGSKAAASKQLERFEYEQRARLLIDSGRIKDTVASFPAVHVCDYEGFRDNYVPTPLGRTTGEAILKALDIPNEVEWREWLKETAPGARREAVKTASQIVFDHFQSRRMILTSIQNLTTVTVPIGNDIQIPFFSFGRIAFLARGYNDLPRVFSGIVNHAIPDSLLRDADTNAIARELFARALKAQKAINPGEKVTINGLLPTQIPDTNHTVDDLIADWCYRAGYFAYRKDQDDSFKREGLNMFLRMRNPSAK